MNAEISQQKTQSYLRLVRELDHFRDKFRLADPGIAYSLRMAEIYRLGHYPFVEPNNKMALDLFEAMLRLPLNQVVKDLIHAQMAAMIDRIDIAPQSLELPIEQGMTLLNCFEQNHDMYVTKLTPLPLSIWTLPLTYLTPPIRVLDDIENLDRQGIDRDAQNVHSSPVVKITQNSMATLVEEYKNSGKTLRKVSSFQVWRSFLSCKQLWKHAFYIAAVLDKMTCDRQGHACSESELMTIILWKISQQSGQFRKSLIESLGLAIASAVENGYVVCYTGRVTRILSVVRYLDFKDVNTTETTTKLAIKTPELNHEIMNMAGNTRKKWLSNQSDDVRRMYDNGDTEVAKKMQVEFVKKLRSEYKNLIETKLLQKIEQESEIYF
jgi:hypothetical protein